MNSNSLRFARQPAPTSALVVLAGLAMAACASPAPDVDAQRVALLQAAEAVEVDAPYEERAAMVERLKALELSDAELKRVQQLCVKGHETLIAGERSHASAASALEAAAKQAPEGRLTAAQEQAVEQAIAGAMQSIKDAKAPLDACIAELNRLEVSRARAAQSNKDER